MNHFKKKTGQFLGEYTVVISIAIFAIIAMMFFIQRGLAARINAARSYALSALEPDIRDVHFDRGGAGYTQVLAEYEPYYITKETDTTRDTDTEVFINGISSEYSREVLTTTNMGIVSTESFARDDDYDPSDPGTGTGNTGGGLGQIN